METFLHPLVPCIIIPVQAAIPPFLKSDVLIASFKFWISKYSIIPKVQHSIFLNSVPGGSIFIYINEYWVRSPLGLIQNNNSPVDFLDTSSTPKAIFCCDLLKPYIRPKLIQKVSVCFYLVIKNNRAVYYLTLLTLCGTYHKPIQEIQGSDRRQI